MRRDAIGTSPQHRTKSSIRHDPLRISDDRALKVAEFTPGGPLRLGVAFLKLPGKGNTGIQIIPGGGGPLRPDHRRAWLRKELGTRT